MQRSGRRHLYSAWGLSSLIEFVGITDQGLLRIARARRGIPKAATEILSEIIDGGGRLNRRGIKGYALIGIDIN
jgi:hypothetical protein